MTPGPTKPTPRRIPCDDFEVTIDGKTFYPHRGESISTLGSQSIAEFKALARFARLSREDRPDTASTETAFDELTSALAARIVGWDLTDMAGRPLPQPDGTSGPLTALSADELYFLLRVSNAQPATVADTPEAPSPSRKRAK